MSWRTHLGSSAWRPAGSRHRRLSPLTYLVLDAALAQVRAWSDSGRPMPVSVNLSARNLLDPQLATQVADLLAVHEVAPELLALEVTETAIMIEPVRAERVLRELAALGIRISLDDFGAGCTSLSQLRTLPISELKIDLSLVIRISLDDFGAGCTSLSQLRTLPISELKIDLSLVIPMTRELDAALIVRSVVDLGAAASASPSWRRAWRTRRRSTPWRAWGATRRRGSTSRQRSPLMPSRRGASNVRSA
nr:EAL domain-containing protein [Cellulomonas sp.]